VVEVALETHEAVFDALDVGGEPADEVEDAENA
jgi:hypothetical protein